jgi:hypothetical protein
MWSKVVIISNERRVRNGAPGLSVSSRKGRIFNYLRGRCEPTWSFDSKLTDRLGSGANENPCCQPPNYAPATGEAATVATYFYLCYRIADFNV